MKNWKRAICALFAMMCVLIFAGCEQMSGGTKPSGTAPGSTGGGLNEHERKLMGTWYYHEATIVCNADKTFNWTVDFSGNGSYIITATGPWGATSDILTLNWDEVALNGKRLSEQEKEDLMRQYFGTTILSSKYEWRDNENIIINNYDTLSRKPYYLVKYNYSGVGVGAIKTEYVKIGEDYNIDFKYGENLFVHAGIPQKYWKSGDWSFEKYEMYIDSNRIEYRPGDNAKIQSPAAYAIYSLSIRGTDNRVDVIIGYKTDGNHKGDTYWFYDGNSYTKRNGTWYRTGGGSSGGTDPRPNDGYTAKAGNIISSAYIQNRERELKCIGFVKSSLGSISASDIYERADPAIGWSAESPIELVPVFAAR